MKVLFATGAAGLAAVAALSWPLQASPALHPAFTATICTAKPPAMDTAFTRGITYAASGSVIRVADTAISTEDHAEFLFKLGLLEGHLRVGQQLIAAGYPDLALPHYGHPVRELYDDVRPELERRGLSQFDGELIGLEALAAGQPKSKAMVAAQERVMLILASLRATVPAPLLDDQRFMLGVLAEVSVVASEDYSQSIEGNAITKPVEYHDSHGYLLYVDRELTRLEARPDLRGSAPLKTARAKWKEMQVIVGALLPPKRPVQTVAQYKAIVAEFKGAAATGT